MYGQFQLTSFRPMMHTILMLGNQIYPHLLPHIRDNTRDRFKKYKTDHEIIYCERKDGKGVFGAVLGYERDDFFNGNHTKKQFYLFALEANDKHIDKYEVDVISADEAIAMFIQLPNNYKIRVATDHEIGDILHILQLLVR